MEFYSFDREKPVLNIFKKYIASNNMFEKIKKSPELFGTRSNMPGYMPESIHYGLFVF